MYGYNQVLRNRGSQKHNVCPFLSKYQDLSYFVLLSTIPWLKYALVLAEKK